VAHDHLLLTTHSYMSQALVPAHAPGQATSVTAAEVADQGSASRLASCICTRPPAFVSPPICHHAEVRMHIGLYIRRKPVGLHQLSFPPHSWTPPLPAPRRILFFFPASLISLRMSASNNQVTLPNDSGRCCRLRRQYIAEAIDGAVSQIYLLQLPPPGQLALAALRHAFWPSPPSLRARHMLAAATLNVTQDLLSRFPSSLPHSSPLPLRTSSPFTPPPCTHITLAVSGLLCPTPGEFLLSCPTHTCMAPGAWEAGAAAAVICSTSCAATAFGVPCRTSRPCRARSTKRAVSTLPQ
jgi:hypothetical protein